MSSLYKILYNELSSMKPHDNVSFIVLNPDSFRSMYSGERVQVDNEECIYFSYRSWIDLANALKCKMLTPKIISKFKIAITYEKLNYDKSFHNIMSDAEEKYGEKSIFSQINKGDEPSFLIPYLDAIDRVNAKERKRILNLGVNNADEFELLQKHIKNFDSLELHGVDYCKSALEVAKKKFKEFANVFFYEADINNLDSLSLKKFDLIISIGTLQSSSLNFYPTFMKIFQNHLKSNGAIILGFPNCRWIDGELIYGARVKNYSFSEMSLLYKDVVFCKKYLQQKKFRVTVTGKDYIFVTGVSMKA